MSVPNYPQWIDCEDYEIGMGDMLPRDWAPDVEELDRRRAIRKRIGKWAFRLTLAFIVIGNIYVWGSWR